MNQRDFFQVGSRLLGLYALLTALILLIGIAPVAIDVFRLGGSLKNESVIQFIPLYSSPLVMTFVGFYLLRSRSLANRLYGETETAPWTQMAEYFTLGLRLYGLYLLVTTIPSLLRVTTNLLFLANHLAIAGTTFAQERFPENILPDVALIACGIALLLRGESLTSWVFPSAEEYVAEDM